MTWNELNERTGDMLPDMLGAAWYDLVDDSCDDDDIYDCQALEIVFETLIEQADGQEDAELLDLRRLAYDIQNAIGKRTGSYNWPYIAVRSF